MKNAGSSARTPFLVGLAIGVVIALMLMLSSRAVLAAAPAIVDCGKGQKIQPKIKTNAQIIVKGNCSENLLIAVDDVIITTDGTTPATISPVDARAATIRLDGAKGVVIDGVGPNGLTINGSVFGITATRGSTLDVRNCRVTGASNTAVASSYSSTVSVDACDLSNNTGNGAVAANVASLVVTDSTVNENGRSGLLALRGGYLRVGQDLGGTPVLRPVTIRGNQGEGIDVVEGGSANVVGGVVEDSGSVNVFVGRSASAQIGEGSSGLRAGVTVRNGHSYGIGVLEGASATIIGSTVTGNALNGIVVSSGASSAWIGIPSSVTAYVGNTISNNGASGILVGIGSSAVIGGNLIDGNGVTGAPDLGRFGILVWGSVVIVGGNTIQNNAGTGVFVVRNGQVRIGDLSFGLPIGNTISGNGTLDPTNGGIFAYQGGVIETNGATISANIGTAVQAFEKGLIELGSTTVTVPATGTTHGASVSLGSTLRFRNGSSIVSGTGDGVRADRLSSVDIQSEPTPSTIAGNGPGAVGVRCFSTTTLTGPLTNVSGTTGQTIGCNSFP